MPRVVSDVDKKKARLEMRINDEDQKLFDQAVVIAEASSISEWARSEMWAEALRLTEASDKKKR